MYKEIGFVEADNINPIENIEITKNFKKVLEKNPEFGIEIVGHASLESDNKYINEEHNIDLGIKRAKKN